MILRIVKLLRFKQDNNIIRSMFAMYSSAVDYGKNMLFYIS